MTIENCNHTDCRFSVPERKKIAQMISDGKSKDKIVRFLAERYGEKVFSAPTKSDIMASVTPIIITFVALRILLIYFKERPNQEEKSHEKMEKLPYDDLIEKELKEIDSFNHANMENGYMKPLHSSIHLYLILQPFQSVNSTHIHFPKRCFL